MESGGSVTTWMMRLRDADPVVRDEATRLIWERYHPWLLGVVRARFDPKERGLERTEDVAWSAFKSFDARQRAGALTLHDRADLARMLRVIVARKICNAIKQQRAQRRDVRRERSADVPGDPGTSARVSLLDLVEASPSEEELSVAMNEALEPIQLALPDPELQEIVRWLLEDFTPAEIAERLGCSKRTVERRRERIQKKLEPLRRQWEGESHE
jgi:RNA polymerase sigma factor (sigma-70 family)